MKTPRNSYYYSNYRNFFNIKTLPALCKCAMPFEFHSKDTIFGYNMMFDEDFTL